MKRLAIIAPAGAIGPTIIPDVLPFEGNPVSAIDIRRKIAELEDSLAGERARADFIRGAIRRRAGEIGRSPQPVFESSIDTAGVGMEDLLREFKVESRRIRQDLRRGGYR